MFLGGGLSNGEWVWVPIPKNASSAHRGVLTTAGWDKAEYGRTVTHLPAYIPVRDPISRWFSGAAQYATRPGQRLDSLVDDVLEGRWPVFDEHTMRQTDFVPSTISDPRYVRLEDAVAFMRQQWGLKLPVVNQRTYAVDRRLIRVLTEFYATDLELYHGL